MFGQQRRKQAAADHEAAASLEAAFKQLDLFGSKLDALKKSYNETAKELAAIEEHTSLRPPAPAPVEPRIGLPMRQVMPTPALAFHPPFPGLPPAPRPVPRPESSRYSVRNPEDPQPVRVPEKPEPKRTRSGRYYLQLSKAGDPKELHKLREEVSKCGRVVDSGSGTASDPEAAWVEVAVRADDTGSFVLKLEELEVKNRVERLVAVSPGEGRLQARTLDLFPKKRDSR